MTLEAAILMGVIVGGCVLIAVFDNPPRNRARYSGSVYDPQRPVIRRAGAVDMGGRVCPLCKVTTFGWSTRCGKCGRLNKDVPLVKTEATRRRSFVESK